MSSESSDSLNPLYRGRFHLSAPAGWLNDPNGFSWFEGCAHLFYQHHPHDSSWGPMHWGHSVTSDFVRWEHLPVALSPDRPYDAQGCFSGGAVTDGERHVLLYTGHVDPDHSDPTQRVETQCLAWGDGVTYRKAEQNPVIGSELLPLGASKGDFRDPKLWKDGDDWYCAVASRHSDGCGQILLFTAQDPLRWRLVGTVLRSEGKLGGMWECPDFSVVEGRDVLLWSVMNHPLADDGFQNPHSVVWAAGSLDRTTGAFATEAIQEIDHGPDFYAPQTLMHPDGRVILVAWMQMWERTIPTQELGHGWAGQMTLPREVFWHRGQLAQRPIRELQAYRRDGTVHTTVLEGRRSFPGVGGQNLDLELEFRAWTATSLGVRLFVGEGEETVLSWEPATGVLTFDRTRAGVPIASKSKTHPECQVYRARVEAPDGVLFLRIILDRSSVEVFAQGGTTAMTSTVYPQTASDGVEVFSVGGTCEVVCRSWRLKL